LKIMGGTSALALVLAGAFPHGDGRSYNYDKVRELQPPPSPRLRPGSTGNLEKEDVQKWRREALPLKGRHENALEI